MASTSPTAKLLNSEVATLPKRYSENLSVCCCWGGGGDSKRMFALAKPSRQDAVLGHGGDHRNLHGKP